MQGFFGTAMRLERSSFCGRLCNRSNSNPNLFPAPGLNLYNGCASQCAFDAMPGYCNKYALTYSPWTRYEYSSRFFYTYRYAVIDSLDGVQQKPEAFFGNRRRNAEKLCNALEPTLGCRNACCSYTRGFESMQIYCAKDANGKVMFDCDKHYGGKNLLADCFAPLYLPVYDRKFEQLALQDYCRGVISRYQASPEYGTAKLYRRSNGKIAVMFPDSLGFNCESEYYNPAFSAGIIANCWDRSELTYVGPAVPPVSGPLPGKGCSGDDDDPCLGTCKDGKECVVNSNGGAFCVECSSFVRRKSAAKDVACCKYDANKKRCVTDRKGKTPGTFQRQMNIFTIDGDGDRVPVSFRKPTGFVCADPRDFRKNGEACRVWVNTKGVAKCAA